MQGFNMGRYHPPASLDASLSNKSSAGFNRRANGKSTQSTGPPTIRFEMPFAIWCTNCKPEQIIGQGVRFNAQKNRVGTYYTTPIWSFTMRHGVCGELIEIRTDPKAGDYVVENGGRKRDYGETDGSRDGVFGEILTEDERAKRAADPFASLEGRVEQGEKAKKEGWWIEKLQDHKDKDWDDVWKANQKLRKTFRVERKELQTKEANREEVADRLGLSIDVLDEAPEDAQRAGLMSFGDTEESAGRDVTMAASRPLFNQSQASSQELSSKGKTKAQLKIEKSKALLHQSVKGNTRAITDPFINSHVKSASRTSLLVGIKRKRVENTTDNLDAETMTASSAVFDEEHGNSKTPHNHHQLSKLPIVAYASDDE